MVSMKKSLIILILALSSLSLRAQKDTTNVIGISSGKEFSREVSVNISIYPVPVRENSFTIKTDRDISFVKITNIIGQDVFRARYSNPQQLLKILLDNPKRGMYLVTLVFSDGSKAVKKIMVEESE
jgi:hypothetical protein